MNEEQLATNLTAIAALIKALGWPVIIVFLVIYFREPAIRFLENVGTVSFGGSASGIGLTIERKMEASANFDAAIAAQGKDGDSEQAERYSGSDTLMAWATQPWILQRLRDVRVLWVDDIPSHNTYERRMFEALGIRFDIATATEDALKVLQFGGIRLVISDMARPNDGQAGYTLLDRMRASDYHMPLVIYGSSSDPKYALEARSKGAAGSTGNPRDLLKLVIDTLLTMQT